MSAFFLPLVCLERFWVGMSRSFRLPGGHAPQWHCCPYSVAEQGEPGGGAEYGTVKRGRGACWHLPSLTAAGRGKGCFSICLIRAVFPPHPPPPVPTMHLLPWLTGRWHSEHCLPWSTVPDAAWLQRHSHSAFYSPVPGLTKHPHTPKVTLLSLIFSLALFVRCVADVRTCLHCCVFGHMRSLPNGCVHTDKLPDVFT